MKVIETEIDGVLIIEPELKPDRRGYFMETFQRDKFRALGLPTDFVQDNHSLSYKNTIRGLHYQVPRPQGKLVRVSRGSVMDVAVDIRKGSPTFGKWVSAELSEDNRRQLWLPPGFTHGFCTLTDIADLVIKCTEIYSKPDTHRIAWDDPDIGIDWPITDPILSDKDMCSPRLRDTTVFPEYRTNV